MLNKQDERFRKERFDERELERKAWRCFIVFILASFLAYCGEGKACEARRDSGGGITWLPGESEWSQTWSCGVCGTTNDESYDSCCACGNSK